MVLVNKQSGYTAVMTRKVLLLTAFLAASTQGGNTPVKITLPAAQYKVQERINANVENIGTIPVTFCVEYGQWSSNNGEIESTPSPFIVQAKARNKWSTLLIGPDVGSIRAPVVLKAGEAHEFPLRLNDVGTMRVLLYYWRGSKPELHCSEGLGGAKRVASPEFSVR
jgi:hypothetical protein